MSKVFFFTGFTSLRPSAEEWAQRGDSHKQIDQATFLTQTGKTSDTIHGNLYLILSTLGWMTSIIPTWGRATSGGRGGGHSCISTDLGILFAAFKRHNEDHKITWRPCKIYI